MPEERYLKEIASELKLIRKELQRKNERDAKVITYLASNIYDILNERYGFAEEDNDA